MPSRDSFFAALGSLPAAVALLTALRWPQTVACPRCGSAAVGGHGRYDRCPDLPRYRCKACRRTFLLTTGTPLAGSRVSLTDWVVIAWLIVLAESRRPTNSMTTTLGIWRCTPPPSARSQSRPA